MFGPRLGLYDWRGRNPQLWITVYYPSFLSFAGVGSRFALDAAPLLATFPVLALLP